MTGVPRIIAPLLVAVVAARMTSSFVPMSPSRTRSNQGVKRWEPIFSTAVNPTLSSTPTTVDATINNGKETYDVGKPKRHARSVSRNRMNKEKGAALPARITKVKPSSQHFRDNNNKSGQKRQSNTEQFQWLHWIYNQWKDTSPGDLTDENVIKQMMAAVPRWSRRKSAKAARHAEELLGRLIQEAIAGNPYMRTNATTTLSEKNASAPNAMLSVSLFNAAMDAYGKIGNPTGVQRILRQMEALRVSGVDDFAHLRPDEFSMSTLATAWAKSHSEEAAKKAEAIIQYMDLNGLVANTITYNSVLHAVAVGNECDRALRAEDLVQRMTRRHQEKGEDCEPDVYTYQSLIQAWSRTTMPGSPQKAERILRFMDNEASSGKNNSHQLTPNAYCFTTVIHSWARSSEMDRARHAYQLLNVMTRRYHDAKSEYKINKTKKNKSHYKLLKPNVKTFTAVLNACARPVDDSEKEDAFAIAQLAMAELSLGTYGKPNFLSYAAYLAVCGTALDVGHTRDAETKKAFRDCIDDGQVGQIVLEKLYMAASPDLLYELLGDHLDERGQIRIPSSWRRSTVGERVGGNYLAQKELSEELVRKIPKAFQQRLQDVQKFGGKSSIYSELNRPTMVKKGEDEILWSKDEFRSTNGN